MAKTTILSMLIYMLFFAQWWHSIVVESADTCEAKVIGAKQMTENSYVALVEDEDVKSGWAVQVKRSFGELLTDNTDIYFYARNDTKTEFESAFASELCALLLNKEDTKNFLSKQIVDMIFPKQKGSCVFKVGEQYIRYSAQVNANSNEHLSSFPKTTPYQLKVFFVYHSQDFDSNDDDYLFHVIFSIGGDIK